MADQTSYFPELLNCLLRVDGDYSEAEALRSTQMTDWLLEHAEIVRAVTFDEERNIAQAIIDHATAHRELPTLSGLRNTFVSVNGATEIRDRLKEFNRQDYALLGVADMGPVLDAVRKEYEQNRMQHSLRFAATINGNGHDRGPKLRRLQGPRDAWNYLVGEMQKGVFVDSTGLVNKTIDVALDMNDVSVRYEERKAQGFIDVSIPGFRLRPTNFLGILGYANSGKSTVARYMSYQAALNGHSVLHVAYENSKEEEHDIYALMHCHNPKFAGEFDHITSEKFMNEQLTDQEWDDFKFVMADYTMNVKGRIHIVKPHDASWPSLKTAIELHALSYPIDLVCLDYLQLLEPEGNSGEDSRNKMSRMIKAVRQFTLSFIPEHNRGRHLCLITPIQSNEEGRKKTEAADGVWTLAGVNQDKELSRSCDRIVGVWNDEMTLANGNRAFMLSCVKERNVAKFRPIPFEASSVNWLTFGSLSAAPVVPVKPAAKKRGGKYVPPADAPTMENIDVDSLGGVQ